MATIPIAEAIQAIRREIVTAVSQGESEDIKFDLGDIELEFQVQLSKQEGGDLGAKGNLNLGVVTLEASGKQNEQQSKATTHRVKLTLKPMKADGTSVKVSAQDLNERPK